MTNTDHSSAVSGAEDRGVVERDISGETVCGFRVAAYRETHPEHGDKYGHAYSEHWSTPNTRNPAVKVERMFTETQLLAALAQTPDRAVAVREALPTDAQVREAMQTAWDDFCDDAQAIPGDISHYPRFSGRTFFKAGTWADHTAMYLRAVLATTTSVPTISGADATLDAVQSDPHSVCSPPRSAGRVAPSAAISEQFADSRERPAPSAEGEKLREALRVHKRWVAACERHNEVLRANPDVTVPAVKRSGQKCAALYSQLCVAAIEVVEASSPAALATPDAAPIGSDDAGDRFASAGKAIPEGMVPWHGGERAPDDWDGGRVLGDDGEFYEPYEDGGLDWQHGLSSRDIGADIIAYTPAALSPAGLKEEG